MRAARRQPLEVPREAILRLSFASFTNVFAWMGFSTVAMKFAPVGEGALSSSRTTARSPRAGACLLHLHDAGADGPLLSHLVRDPAPPAAVIGLNRHAAGPPDRRDLGGAHSGRAARPAGGGGDGADARRRDAGAAEGVMGRMPRRWAQQ